MSQKPIDSEAIGESFQELTKYHRSDRGRFPRAKAVAPLKTYPPGLPRVSLPTPDQADGPPLWQVIRQRRSVRRYGETPLTLKALSQLLWAAQGVTGHTQRVALRAAPSAGALYPVESYVAVNRVERILPALYHYDAPAHSLTQITESAVADPLAEAALNQQMCATSAVTFIWTAVIPRSAQKYAQRAYRYIYLDAGHIAQNVALAATALGLGSCAIAALYDDEINTILNVDGKDETVLYLTAVGPLA